MGCLRCLGVMASDLDSEQAPELLQVCRAALDHLRCTTSWQSSGRSLYQCAQYLLYTVSELYSNHLPGPQSQWTPHHQLGAGAVA